jgi:integrase/recombinase XerD
MNKLREAVEQYLQLRGALGYKLEGVVRLLRSFVTFAEREGAAHVTTDLALRWAQQPLGVQPATWAWRLSVLRRFAVWLSASDQHTQVPPTGLLPGHYRRKRPYIYSDAEIETLVDAASRLPSTEGLKGHTFSTVFGLLAVTGLRVSEALALDRKDVDLQQGILRIRRTKFGKSRLVMVHETTRQVLANYADRRDRVVRRPATSAFFLSEQGDRVKGGAARYNFAKVSRHLGMRTATTNCRHGHGPRLHDMRHRFAVRTLLGWYRAGIDVEREMPKLTTYLGHVHVHVTYWYIEAVPELLELAARRLESPVERKT